MSPIVCYWWIGCWWLPTYSASGCMATIGWCYCVCIDAWMTRPVVELSPKLLRAKSCRICDENCDRQNFSFSIARLGIVWTVSSNWMSPSLLVNSMRKLNCISDSLIFVHSSYIWMTSGYHSWVMQMIMTCCRVTLGQSQFIRGCWAIAKSEEMVEPINRERTADASFLLIFYGNELIKSNDSIFY